MFFKFSLGDPGKNDLSEFPDNNNKLGARCKVGNSSPSIILKLLSCSYTVVCVLIVTARLVIFVVLLIRIPYTIVQTFCECEIVIKLDVQV